MAWLYVPGLEASTSDSSSPTWAIEPCAFASGTLSRRPSSWRGWKTRSWIERLSGTISQPSMADRGVESWTSSLRGFPANRTPSQGTSEATTTSAPSGLTSSASSGRSSPRSSSSKTSPPSSSTPSPSGGSFERWATNGLRRYWRRPRTKGRPTTEPGSFSSLPSPRASDGPNGGPNMRGSKGDPMLPGLVCSLPTPRESDGSHGMGKDTVDRLIRALPTATASDANGSGAAGYSTSSGRHSGTTLTDALLGAASVGRSGRLNPQLSEWVMGLPTGWTDCEQSVTESFRSWWRRHSEHY